MNLLPLPGSCGADAIIPDTGGITGIGTIIISSGADAIIRLIIFITPADGTKADTITMHLPADRHTAAVTTAEAEAEADAEAEAVTAAADTAAADGISPESL